MIYLKRFNESVSVDEIKDFCKEYLAYLIDDGFDISTETLHEPNYNKKITDYICLTLKSSKKGDEFYWNDIKDDFIPFITILSEKYKLDRKRCIWFNGIKYYTYRDPFTQLGMDDRRYRSETVRKIYMPKSIIEETLSFKYKLQSITIFIK